MRSGPILLIVLGVVSCTLPAGCPQGASPDSFLMEFHNNAGQEAGGGVDSADGTGRSDSANPNLPTYDTGDVIQTTSEDDGGTTTGNDVSAVIAGDRGWADVNDALASLSDDGSGGASDAGQSDDDEIPPVDDGVDDGAGDDPNGSDPGEGDPNSDPGGDDPNRALVTNTGFSGTYARLVTFDVESWILILGDEYLSWNTVDRMITVAFDESGLPRKLTVPTYQPHGDEYFVEMPFGPVGTEQTFDLSSSGTIPAQRDYGGRLTARIESVALLDGVGEIVLSLTHSSGAGVRDEVGTGTQTISFEMAPGGLAYDSWTRYDLDGTAGAEDELTFTVYQILDTDLTLPAR